MNKIGGEEEVETRRSGENFIQIMKQWKLYVKKMPGKNKGIFCYSAFSSK